MLKLIFWTEIKKSDCEINKRICLIVMRKGGGVGEDKNRLSNQMN